MKSEQLKSYIEVHVCNHRRENEECCYDKGAKDLTDQLKKWAKEETNKEVRVFRSGCLGKCSEGIAIACYPDKKLLLDVSEDDYKEIKSMLKKRLEDLKK